MNAFYTSKMNDAVTALTVNAAVEMSSSIEIKARTIAKDESKVSFAVQSLLPNTWAIIVLCG